MKFYSNENFKTSLSDGCISQNQKMFWGALPLRDQPRATLEALLRCSATEQQREKIAAILSELGGQSEPK